MNRIGMISFFVMIVLPQCMDGHEKSKKGDKVKTTITQNSQSKKHPFFQANRNQPYHLSIGAVLFDNNGHIACHHFKEVAGLKDIYILMRESMEDNETPLATLARGLKEEFGATAQPVAFLGCLTGLLPNTRFPFDKTTLYIACKVIHWDAQDRDQDDGEAGSIIEWLEPKVLIAHMQKQGERFNHQIDLDESDIIKRALPHVQQYSKSVKP